MNLNAATSKAAPAAPGRLFDRLMMSRGAMLSPLVYAGVPAVLMLVLGLLFVSGAYGTQDDDGYIFYQYARNLAEGYGLSFNPGEVSYGVTSGAWVGLLALVHRLTGGDIIIEAQALGLVLCAVSAGLWAWAAANWTGSRLLGLVGASIYALELDALKSSLSGLETGLNLALFAALAALLSTLKFDRPLLLGAVFGLAVLTRPDNFALALPVLGVASASNLPWRQLLGNLATFGATTLLAVAPWYGWLWVSTGSPIPPTQTGKLLVFLPITFNITLGEYQALSPVGRMLFGLDALAKFASGGGPVRVAVLALGGLLVLSLALGLMRGTRRYAMLPTLLAGGLLLQALVYAWSFPLLKLRYLINLLPVGLVLGTAALCLLLNHYRLGRSVPSPASLSRPAVAAAMIALVVLASGAWFYSREVGRQVDNYRYYVEVQEVRRQVGVWLRDNTPAGSLVALEPIGDVAFYAERRILDLGGLIDQSAWPALASGYGDGAALAAFLTARHADYLVEYTNPAGIGGAGNALAYLPPAKKVSVIELPQEAGGSRDQYASYTIYSLGAR